MRNKLFIITFILGGITFSFFTHLKLSVQFNAQEVWIPKNQISQSINSYDNIKLIQLIHWPLVKKQLLKKYPMINSIDLSFKSVNQATVVVVEKQPWVIIMSKNKVQLFSEDGILLNPQLNDFELPNESILMVKAMIPIIENNMIMPNHLETLKSLSKNLKRLPFLTVQQIIINSGGIQVINDQGLRINVGDNKKLDEKFIKLKYFMGNYRQKVSQMDFLDIQFSKRVIIK